MINAAFVVWVALRITRWISWMSFLAYSFAITISADRSSYLDHFGPLYSTEAWLFGLPMLALTLWLFELMMREQAGITRTWLLPLNVAKSAPFQLTGTGSQTDARMRFVLGDRCIRCWRPRC